jgi:putative PIN family toxin of toxin-antitoxin system
MAKVVIDANVIISAAFGGRPFEAVVRAMGDHEVYSSEATERELQGVVSRLSRKLSKDQMSFLEEKVRQLLSHARRVSVSPHLTLSRDAKDDHYLSLCKAAKADFLITGDKDLLSVSEEALRKNGISVRIVTPQKFLENVP